MEWMLGTTSGNRNSETNKKKTIMATIAKNRRDLEYFQRLKIKKSNRKISIVSKEKFRRGRRGPSEAKFWSLASKKQGLWGNMKCGEISFGQVIDLIETALDYLLRNSTTYNWAWQLSVHHVGLNSIINSLMVHPDTYFPIRIINAPIEMIKPWYHLVWKKINIL